MCQEPTKFLLIGYLTESIWIPRFTTGTLTPNTRWQTYWQKDTSNVTNGLIFFVCSTSATSALFAAARISAWLAATKRWRNGCKNNHRKTGLWRNPGQRRGTWPVLLLQVLHLWTVQMRREAGRYSKLQDRLDYPNPNRNSIPDAASSSQCWQRDAQLFFSAGKLVATDTDQNSPNRLEELVSTRKLVAMVMTEHQGCSEKAKIPQDSGDSKPKSRIWPHHFRKSPDCVLHMKKVFSIVRGISDRKPTDEMKDLDVNTAIWSTFMSVTLQAAIHLGPDYSMNFRSVKISSSKSV